MLSKSTRLFLTMLVLAVAGVACVLFAFGITQADPAQKTLTSDLAAAARKGDRAAVARLLKDGADPNRRETVRTKPSLADHDPGNKEVPGDTPLTIATQEGHRQIVDLLIAKGADVNGRGEAGYTPLIAAASRSRADIARLLLAHRAKPDLRNDVGDTALVFAANGGDIDLVRLLLEKGADINGGAGWTPLMQASYNGWEKVARLLLQKRADPNLRRDGLMTALECAEAQGNESIAVLLRKAGAKGRTRDAVEREGEKAAREWKRDREKEQQRKPRQTLTKDDQAVIELVLLDILASSQRVALVQVGGSQIFLIDRTATGDFLSRDDQINGELDVPKTNDISLDMREDLVRRSGDAISLSAFRPHSAQIILRSESVLGERIGAFETSHPRASGWIQAKLPGYSKTRDRAVLRFHLGPSPHGAAGTYLLVREGATWRVKWRNFAFFV